MPAIAGMFPELNGENARADISTNLGVVFNWRWEEEPSPYGASEGASSLFYNAGLFMLALAFSGVVSLPWPGDYHLTAGTFLTPGVHPIGPQIDGTVTAPSGTTPDAPYPLPSIDLPMQQFIHVGYSWFAAANAAGADLMQPPLLVNPATPSDMPAGVGAGGSIRTQVNLDYSLAMRNEMAAAYPSGVSFHCFAIDPNRRATVAPFAAVQTTAPTSSPPPPPPGVVSAQGAAQGTIKRRGRVTGQGGRQALNEPQGPVFTGGGGNY